MKNRIKFFFVSLNFEVRIAKWGRVKNCNLARFSGDCAFLRSLCNLLSFFYFIRIHKIISNEYWKAIVTLEKHIETQLFSNQRIYDKPIFLRRRWGTLCFRQNNLGLTRGFTTFELQILKFLQLQFNNLLLSLRSRPELKFWDQIRIARRKIF